MTATQVPGQRGRQLVAPAAPFTAAIVEWCRRADPAIAHLPSGERVVSRLQRLCNEAHIGRVTAERLAAGEYDFIDLARADRVSLAIDVPLSLLAEDFRPLEEWR